MSKKDEIKPLVNMIENLQTSHKEELRRQLLDFEITLCKALRISDVQLLIARMVNQDNQSSVLKFLQDNP